MDWLEYMEGKEKVCTRAIYSNEFLQRRRKVERKSMKGDCTSALGSPWNSVSHELSFKVVKMLRPAPFDSIFSAKERVCFLKVVSSDMTTTMYTYEPALKLWQWRARLEAVRHRNYLVPRNQSGFCLDTEVLLQK